MIPGCTWGLNIGGKILLFKGGDFLGGDRFYLGG